MAFEIGMREIMIAIFIIVVLLIFALMFLGLIGPGSEATVVFGERVSTGGGL